MSTASVSRQQAEAAIKKHGTKSAAAKALGTSETSIRRAMQREPDEATSTTDKGYQWTEKDDAAEIRADVASDRPIRNLDDLMSVLDVDWDVWLVEHWSATAWTTTLRLKRGDEDVKDTAQNYRVSAKLKRKVPSFVDEGLKLLEKRLGTYRPKLLKPLSAKSGHLLEISPFDVHIGRKPAGERQSLKEQGDAFVSAGLDLLAKSAGFGIEKILLPLGQDFFQIDNIQKTTVNGTPQDTNGEYAEMFAQGVESCERLIDELQQRAPVEVVYVWGNHDKTVSWHLVHALSLIFRGCPRVTFDLEWTPRKYRRHGQSIIGLTHGNEEKHADLGNILAAECRQWWGETVYAEMHVGHFHKAKETRFNAADTHGNVVVRILPSLSKTDRWHRDKGYVTGSRAAQAFVWGRLGLEAMLESRAA